MNCLISDFDGTLHDSNFEKNVESVIEFVSSGNIFIINTGRVYARIKDILEKYNIPYKYVICSDGSVIYDNKGNIVFEFWLNDNLKNDIISYLSSKYDNINIMIDDGFDVSLDYEKKACRIFVSKVGNLKDLQIMNDINQKFKVKTYLSTKEINIIDSKNSKLTAIDFLKKFDNLESIYTIGDSFNDVEMLLNYNGHLVKNNDLDDNYNLPIVDSVEQLIEQLKDI